MRVTEQPCAGVCLLALMADLSTRRTDQEWQGVRRPSQDGQAQARQAAREYTMKNISQILKARAFQQEIQIPDNEISAAEDLGSAASGSSSLPSTCLCNVC